MKSISKKIISVALCGVLMAGATVGLAGCGDSEKDPVEEGATVLKFWVRSFDDWADNLLTKQVREFNSILDDGIQIDLRFYGDDNVYDTAINAGFENDSGADIFMAQYDRIYTYLKNGYIAPIGDYFTEEERADFFDNVREEVTYTDPADGKAKMFACPWRVDPSMMLFYNKEIFERAGVAKVPASWDELYDACEKVKGVMNSSRNEFAISTPTTSVELTWTTYGIVQDVTGGMIVDESWTKSRLDGNEAQFKKCAELWYNLSKNGYAPLAAMTPAGYQDNIDKLCEGQVGMALGGSWAIGRIYNYYPEMAEKIGVAEMPTHDGDQTGVTSCNGGWTYVISKSMSEENRRKATEFLRWYQLTPENGVKYFIESYASTAPTRKSTKTALEASDMQVDPQWAALVNRVAEKANMPPACAWAVPFQMGMLFEYCFNNAKTRTLDAIFAEKLDEVKASIASTISQPGYEANPKYTAKS